MCIRDRYQTVFSKWPSISERRSPTEQVTHRVDLDRAGMSASGLTQLTIRIAKNWMTQSRATSLGTEMATLVAVDLRATQPDRTGTQSCCFGSCGNVGQWPDPTYDPNCQEMDAIKSGYISGDRDGDFSGRRSPSGAARPNR